MPKLAVYLTVDNSLAEELLNGVSLHQLALDEAISFCKANDAELIQSKSTDLLSAIKSSSADIIVIHDALRPLVSAVQMQRTFDSLGNFDAVRPTMAFTETIKSLDNEGRLNQTIDRDKVRRISSPEVIRKSAIDFEGQVSTWSLPLKADAKVHEVEADSESIRINSAEELRMMNALLALRK